MKRKKKDYLTERLKGEKPASNYPKAYHKYERSIHCPDCGASCIQGRWTWKPAVHTVHEVVCPACKKIDEGNPEGFLTLSGPFFREYRNEILQMVRDLERKESSANPLQRIMKISDGSHHVLITTTGIQMAQRLSEAIQNRFPGILETIIDRENKMKIHWKK